MKYSHDRTDSVNLPAQEPRCEPSTTCNVRSDCARFQAALPAKGATLRDYSLEPCGGTPFCDGYTSVRHYRRTPQAASKPSIHTPLRGLA